MMEPTLPDELLLLALHDERGSVIPAAAPVLNSTLVGAILMELALRGRLSDNADGTLSADPAPTGDEILDDVTRRIASAEQPRDGRTWVVQLNRHMPDLKDRLLARLVAAGVLEQRDRRIFWVFPSRSFPLADGATERQARDRIRAVVLDGATPDQRTAALISLVRACNLNDEVFAPHERPQARRRTIELTEDETAESGMFGTGLDAALLFGLAGITTMYAYHQLHQSAGATNDDWAFDRDQSWSSRWPDSSSSSTSDAGSSSGTESESSGSSWWWWGSGSDSSSNDNNSNDNSSGSWWDSGSSDSGG